MTYEPTPLDISQSKLALSKKLAENARDGWIRQRLADSCKLAWKRDDGRRTIPAWSPKPTCPAPKDNATDAPRKRLRRSSLRYQLQKLPEGPIW